MKILVLAMVVMALGQGFVESCRKRSDRQVMRELRATTRCTEPQEALVQLPVPEGYHYLRPSVVKVKQCTGLSCPSYPEKCLPVPESNTLKEYNVFAYNVEDHIPKCVQVKVEEHEACECRCDKTVCLPNEVFDEETCGCECNEAVKSRCLERIDAGENVAWSGKACSCLCNHQTKCDSSMTWMQELCRCVNKYYLDYSIET